ncbi:MAG: hypothetical protein CML98_08095 [Rhodobiaceae bacterium]|nr:hypothetical protein [Rhodobiaceae bacterium]|tara:strand:- start:15806 stop:16789 length:984 start_codon:yes stop_codon:yes gene_type:complete
MKSISVCMATYNGEKFIKNQIETIINQSLKPRQLIISDDSSSDKTVEIIKRITHEVDFEVKIYINKKSLGVVKNFEKAMSHCNSDIIVLSDQDDLWDSNRLQHISDMFKEKKIDYYFSDSKVIDSTGKVTKYSLWQRRSFTSKLQNSYNNSQLPILLKYENFIYGMTLAFKSKKLDKIIPIESESRLLTHDGWVSMILSGLNYKGYADNYSTTFYRQHGNQVAGPGNISGFLTKMFNSIRNNRLYDKDYPNDLEKIALKISNAANPNSKSLKFAGYFKDKANHLRFRENLMKLSFFTRLKLIIREVRSGKYKKYSSSKLAFLRDLIG